MDWIQPSIDIHLDLVEMLWKKYVFNEILNVFHFNFHALQLPTKIQKKIPKISRIADISYCNCDSMISEILSGISRNFLLKFWKSVESWAKFGNNIPMKPIYY